MTPSDQTRPETELLRLQLRHLKSHYQAAADKAAEQQRSHPAPDHTNAIRSGKITVETAASARLRTSDSGSSLRGHSSVRPAPRASSPTPSPKDHQQPANGSPIFMVP